MPSVGHLAVGIAAGRLHGRRGCRAIAATAVFSALSLLPDADVLAFTLGIPYRAPFGHRGAFHSLSIAVALGVLAALAVGGLWRSRLRMGVTAVVVTVSHDLLDAMTNGGLGIALFWPFSNARVFLPWRPIPVAPIGIRFISSRGLSVLLTELLLFSPFLLYGLWPRRRPDEAQASRVSRAGPPPAT
jgi:inner membrane protein